MALRLDLWCKNMHTKPRRRIQRAFAEWLTANRQRISIPVSIASRTDSRLELRLAGINTAIQVCMHESKFKGWTRSMIRGGYVRQFLKGFPANSYKKSFAEIVVGVDYEGVTWDLLTCIELSEIHQPDGYSCELCDPANRML